MGTDIVSLFYDVTQYKTTSGDPDYISTASVRQDYGPSGLKQLNNALGEAGTVSVDWTAATVSTGNPIDDHLIAEWAAFFGDQRMDAWHIDPETGLRINRHWETAMNVFKLNYGVVDSRGQVRFPGDATRAAGSLVVANASDDSTDRKSDV